MDHEGRVERVASRLAGAHVDGLLVTDMTNITYLTGFSGTNGQLLVTEHGATFFSDRRYRARAEATITAAETSIYRERLIEVLPDALSAHRAKALGFEERTVTVATHRDLSNRLEGVELVPTVELVEDLRRSKDPDEVALIKSAVAIGDEVFARTLERIRPGTVESDLGLELEFELRRAGAEGISFPPIVGSGPLSAHIHHSPSERAFEKGDLVLLDFGCRVEGYCSDMTRTVVLGSATDEQARVYDLVLRAQRAGTEAIRPDMPAADVDAAARNVVEKQVPAERFGHGLGHGVGLDIHEAPRLERDEPGDVEDRRRGYRRARRVRGRCWGHQDRRLCSRDGDRGGSAHRRPERRIAGTVKESL